MRIQLKDIREEPWYEVVRVAVLWLTMLFLVANLQYTRGNRRVGTGNREVQCMALKVGINNNQELHSATSSQLLQEAAETLRKDC